MVDIIIGVIVVVWIICDTIKDIQLAKIAENCDDCPWECEECGGCVNCCDCHETAVENEKKFCDQHAEQNEG